tara:strand:+ start:182 stop:748 length:567 start_codon:yes stop_codon:yes gene_type:complete
MTNYYVNDTAPGSKIHFLYIDRNNKITEQKTLLISHKEFKFYARCEIENRVKCYLYESVLMDLFTYSGSIDNLLKDYQCNYKEHIPQRREPSTLNLENKPEIQFTGFYSVLKMNQIKTKDELVKLAKDNDYFTKKSKTLGLNVSILVCGPNAGPVKMKQASDRGAILLNESQFIHMIENGGELIDEGE